MEPQTSRFVNNAFPNDPLLSNPEATSKALNPKVLSIPDLLNYISLLESYVKKCQKSKEFIEAEAANMKVAELKSEVVAKKRNELQLKQNEEKYEIEDSHNVDLKNFNDFWTKKLAEFESEADNVKAQMTSKFHQDILKMAEDIRENMPMRPKSTPQMLNYRKILEHLAKQREFAEAHRIKKLLEELEARERELAISARESKISSLANQMNQRHSAEFAALQKRIDSGRAELLKAKKLEAEKLEHKYRNIKKEAELIHQHENSKFEIAYRNYIPKTTIQISPEIKGIKNLQNISLHDYSSILGNSAEHNMAIMIHHNEKRSQTAQQPRGTQSDQKRSNSKSNF